MLNNKNYLQSSLEISLYFLPISFLLGTLIVNLNLIIFIFLSTIYLIIKKIKVNFNLSNLILLAFFLTLIFSSYKNIEQIGIENFLKSIFLLKFYMLYIYVEALLFERKINTRYFFNICLIASVFISLDLSLQFFYGKNILGYEPVYGRITGILEMKLLQDCIQKIFAFSMIGLFILFYPSQKSNSLIIYFFNVNIWFIHIIDFFHLLISFV